MNEIKSILTEKFLYHMENSCHEQLEQFKHDIANYLYHKTERLAETKAYFGGIRAMCFTFMVEEDLLPSEAHNKLWEIYDKYCNLAEEAYNETL